MKIIRMSSIWLLAENYSNILVLLRHIPVIQTRTSELFLKTNCIFFKEKQSVVFGALILAGFAPNFFKDQYNLDVFVS